MNKEYWKSTLSSGEKIIYDRMYNSFKSFESDVPCGNTNAKDIAKIYEAVYNDHPELFYLSHSPKIFQSIGFLSKSDKTLHSDFIYSSSELRTYQSELDRIVQKLKSRIRGLSESEQERHICDYIIENTDYEINNKYNQNAITVLLKHKGQCSGIAKATKLLFDRIGIETLLVSGEIIDERANIRGPHAWNIVRINGEYHHLDVTSIIGCNPTKEKPFIYLYYNVSDEQIEKDHKWDKTLVPRCGSSKVDNRESTINSLYELRELLKSIDYSNNSTVSFNSNIPCSDINVLSKYIIQTSLDVLKQMKKRMRVQIKVMGQMICLTFEKA